MSEHFRDFGVYKKLKPYPVSFFAMVFVYLFFLLVIDGMCIFGTIDFIRQGDYGGMLFSIAVLAVVSLFLIRNALKNIKYRINAAKQRMKIRNSLSYNEFAELEAEINNTERFCGTFYFLEKFVYVPKARLLIEYENITKIMVITHITDGLKDGVKTVITDNNDVTCEFWVFNWKHFLENQSLFREKISKGNAHEFAERTEKASV